MVNQLREATTLAAMSTRSHELYFTLDNAADLHVDRGGIWARSFLAGWHGVSSDMIASHLESIFHS